ncbi:hypothetical protein Cantr_09162 [Candida viswanathii]|uniref:Uncharacterized protein n=1 Tax=Candida viswanathii TaxID=5486 RepID=A0A367YA74_9ASCO|nr:hypothetical protein Cantr_09162 [Candida viswanathii]
MPSQSKISRVPESFKSASSMPFKKYTQCPSTYPSKGSAIDLIWSLITTEETVPVYDLLELLCDLENESTGYTYLSVCHLTNDFMSGSWIFEQTEFLRTITKEQAFNLVYLTLRNMAMSDDGTIARAYSGSDPIFFIDDLSDDNDSDDDYDDIDLFSEYSYEDSATLVEAKPSSPDPRSKRHIFKKQEVVINWVKPNIKATLTKLKIFHIKLGQQYAALEDELSEIERRSSLELEELEKLIKCNDQVCDRIDSIREELSGIGDELVKYKDRFHLNRSLGIKGNEPVLPSLCCDDVGLAKLEKSDASCSSVTALSKGQDGVRLPDAIQTIPGASNKEDEEEQMEKDSSGDASVEWHGTRLLSNVIFFILVVLFISCLLDD